MITDHFILQGKYMELDLATAASTFDEEASKAFVAEFIKYRFGAFEEHGHDGSDVYPLFYRKLEEVSQQLNQGSRNGSLALSHNVETFW